MAINSREKGQRGERAWRDELKEAGFDARRGQQFSGSKDSPDVVCEGLPSIHFEVKYCERFNNTDTYNALAQAKNDAGDYKLPVVAHRKNNHDWIVIMNGTDWLNLIKETDRVVSIFCPKCKSANVSRNGFSEKSRQRYICECGKQF